MIHTFIIVFTIELIMTSKYLEQRIEKKVSLRCNVSKEKKNLS